MNIIKALYLVILITSLSLSDNHILDKKVHYIDALHTDISKQVLYWSDYLDSSISGWLIDDEDNKTCEVDPVNFNSKGNNDLDAFFQSDRYLNETRDIFLRLRINNYAYSREKNKINVRLNAQLPFDRCRKNWKIFLQNSNSHKDEIKSTDTSTGGVGIRYFGEEKFGIKSSYAIGLNSSYPYVRARYKLLYKYKDWEIEPIQIFKYSSKYYFEEETDIYFDKHINTDDLFRIQLHRKSASDLEGTDYGITFQYYWNRGKDAGIKVTQSFFGNTHYDDFYKHDKDYIGINNYVTSVSWRENIWRKWFYYEIRPTINFHKDYNYEPSYSLRFFFDFYFGDYH